MAPMFGPLTLSILTLNITALSKSALALTELISQHNNSQHNITQPLNTDLNDTLHNTVEQNDSQNDMPSYNYMHKVTFEAKLPSLKLKINPNKFRFSPVTYRAPILNKEYLFFY